MKFQVEVEAVEVSLTIQGQGGGSLEAKVREHESVTEPRGQEYDQLLIWLAARFDQALLVRRLDQPIYGSGLDLLNQLEPHLIEKTLSSEWPGTVLYGHEAEVIRFNLNDMSLRILLRSAQGLFEWQQPELPEDLSVLRNDGEAVLLSIAHEELWVLALADRELSQLEAEAPSVFAALYDMDEKDLSGTMCSTHSIRPPVQAREAVIHLLRDTLEGKVKLEEIDERWPFEDDRFDEVLEDIHHGVEHTPGRLFSRGVDFRAWESMWEYWQLYLDLKLFEAGLPDAEILRLRDQIDVVHLDGLHEVEFFLRRHLGPDQPRFPLTIIYSDGEECLVDSKVDLERDIEWLDTEDAEEPVEVKDALGRSVVVKMRFLQIEKLELEAG